MSVLNRGNGDVVYDIMRLLKQLDSLAGSVDYKLTDEGWVFSGRYDSEGSILQMHKRQGAVSTRRTICSSFPMVHWDKQNEKVVDSEFRELIRMLETAL